MIRAHRSSRRDLRNGLLFITPWAIGFLVFTAYPLVSSFWYSLTDFGTMRAPNFVGLRNYVDLFVEDALFWKALYNTFYYAAFALPLGAIVSLSLAILLNRKLPGVTIFRTIYFLPSILPLVAVSIVWQLLLIPQTGLVNVMIRSVGLKAPGWFADPNWAKAGLVLISVWKIGDTMIIYLAALQDVPVQLTEAAILDGANAWKRLTNVTLPLISPAILFNVITGMVGTLQYFTTVYVLTNGDGGPVNSTMMYSLLLYRNAFKYLKMGYASAMAWILLVITLGITLLIMRASGKLVYYGGK
ncbi:MAG: sugar ABC transporter permease [Chloroflexi bacterium]|nr:sugar ABC transporter permease [Chloroflexota bacterium]